jgi:hypothetical protein
MARTSVIRGSICCAVLLLIPGITRAQQPLDRARDRGPGIPSSMFGTYIEQGEVLIYPFFEYYRDSDAEYSPDELGYGLDEDFRGRYRASEALLFVGWGVSKRLALEFEIATISATQEKSPDDPTAMPASITESGLGDVEGQVRWRWTEETSRAPELFSYFETVFPLQKNRQLIGTSDWEFKLGTGVVRGFSWGTTTFRAAVEYDGAEGTMALGEFALEYLKRLSPSWRVLAAVEGSEDEIEGITELQWRLRPNVVLKLNNAVGLTSKATDWAPEIGIMFSFR